MSVCKKSTRAHPNGRTGTIAGYQAHYKAREPACQECLDATATERKLVKRQQYERAYDRNPQMNRSTNLKAKYGITDEQYDEMLVSQGGVCAICGTDNPGGRWGTAFMVDHDHTCCPWAGSCGKCIRGLICSPCNIGLGSFRDNVDTVMAAAAYLMSTRNVLEVQS